MNIVELYRPTYSKVKKVIWKSLLSYNDNACALKYRKCNYVNVIKKQVCDLITVDIKPCEERGIIR